MAVICLSVHVGLPTRQLEFEKDIRHKAEYLGYLTLERTAGFKFKGVLNLAQDFGCASIRAFSVHDKP